MKYAWIENNRDEYTVSRLCRVLLVSARGIVSGACGRSAHGRWRTRPWMRRWLRSIVIAEEATADPGSRSSFASRASA